MSNEPNESDTATPLASSNPPDPTPAEEAVDPKLAHLLERRFRRIRRASGPEPTDLEDVARFLDGTLAVSRWPGVEARIEADPELGETVARLRDLEGTNKVVPLIIPPPALRVGQAALEIADKYRQLDEGAMPRGIQALARPPSKTKDAGSYRRFIGTGVMAALAIAAVVFLATRPQLPRTHGGSNRDEAEGTLGAGVGANAAAVELRFQDRSGGQDLVVNSYSAKPEHVLVLVTTPRGTTTVGALPVEAGKNHLLVAIPGAAVAGECRFVLALLGDASDGAAVAAKLGTVVSESCVLDSLDEIKARSGARELGFIRSP